MRDIVNLEVSVKDRDDQYRRQSNQVSSGIHVISLALDLSRSEAEVLVAKFWNASGGSPWRNSTTHDKETDERLSTLAEELRAKHYKDPR